MHRCPAPVRSGRRYCNTSPAKGWTRDLSNLPDISDKFIETYFCADNTAAYKHKREGYQLYKDGYVKQVRVMPRVQGDVKTLYAIKCTVTASMRAQKYEVKAHLCQETGVVLFADCNCKSSAGGGGGGCLQTRRRCIVSTSGLQIDWIQQCA